MIEKLILILIIILIIIYIIYKDVKSIKNIIKSEKDIAKKYQVYLISKAIHIFAFLLFLLNVIFDLNYYLIVGILWFFSEFLYTFNPVNISSKYNKVIIFMRYLSLTIVIFLIFLWCYNQLR